jgi:hypothetical protein
MQLRSGPGRPIKNRVNMTAELDQETLSKVTMVVRGLAMDAVHACSSGHLRLPLGCAESGSVSFGHAFSHWPKHPEWLDRDRFVLSAGHGSMPLYPVLHPGGDEPALDWFHHVYGWAFEPVPSVRTPTPRRAPSGARRSRGSRAKGRDPSRNSKARRRYSRNKTAFIAMAMTEADPRLDDVLDAIKDGASAAGVHAVRVDEITSGARIGELIQSAIAAAHFVIVDLTYERPNVYFEAGYAQAAGKAPVFLAPVGVDLPFDVRDYPIIRYANLRLLKERLAERLRAMSASDNARLPTSKRR